MNYPARIKAVTAAARRFLLANPSMREITIRGEDYIVVVKRDDD